MRLAIITSVAAASSSIKSLVMLDGQRRKTTGDSSPSKCCRVFKKWELRLGKPEGIASGQIGDHRMYPVCTTPEGFQAKQKHLHHPFPICLRAAVTTCQRVQRSRVGEVKTARDLV